jgi:hypothetical protein
MQSEEEKGLATAGCSETERVSGQRPDDACVNDGMGQSSASRQVELSEGLTEFLLKKIIELRSHASNATVGNQDMLAAGIPARGDRL